MVCASLSLYCKYGRTALMWASKGGHTATVELLLGAGADKEVKDEVREGMRENYTRARAYDWLDGLKERKHRVASLPIVGAEASTTCSLGPGLGAAITHPHMFGWQDGLNEETLCGLSSHRWSWG